MNRIVVVGSSNTDMVVRVPHLPDPGETVLGGTFFQAAGGKGANQAVAAARAGGTVFLVACLGNDHLGDAALAGFIREGIDISGVHRVDGTASGVALIVVAAGGENSIAVASGANALITPDIVKAAETVISAANIVLLQLEIPIETVEAAAALAIVHGKSVILNPAPAHYLPEAIWPCISILTPNRAEASMLAGIPVKNRDDISRAGSLLLDKGIGAVVMTLGSDGVFVAKQDTQKWIPAKKIQAKDTTGAGDVFNGTLAVALAQGATLLEAVHFANTAAGISATRFGAQPSAPRLDEIMSYVHHEDV